MYRWKARAKAVPGLYQGSAETKRNYATLLHLMVSCDPIVELRVGSFLHQELCLKFSNWEMAMRLIHAARCIVLLLPVFVHAASSHVHGVSKMDLALDGNMLTLAMEVPLDNVLGFEHFPQTEKQHAALAGVLKTLKDASELFFPTAAAECKLESVRIADPFPDSKAKSEGHVDVDAEYVFRCAKPAALKSLETSLFKRFRRLQRIDVQRVTGKGQGAAKMSPQQPRITW